MKNGPDQTSKHMKQLAFLVCFLFLFCGISAQDKNAAGARQKKGRSYRKALKNPLAAKYLIIKHYRDSVFPGEDLLQFKNLEHINIIGVYHKSVTSDTLFMSYLRIDSARLKQLPALRTLEMSNFDLHGRFPEELFVMKQLETLAIAVCGIKAIPPGIAALKSLTFLECRVNEISTLPKEMAQLEKLEDLDLCNNKFSLLPEVLADMPALKNLSLNNVESGYYIPPSPKYPIEVFINMINVLPQYFLIRKIAASDHFKKMYLVACKEDALRLWDLLNGDELTEEVHCSGARCD